MDRSSIAKSAEATGLFTRIATGNISAQATPCGVPHSTPSAAATPWAIPNPALASAIPDSKAAWLIAPRASRSVGSRSTRGNARTACTRPSRARARGNGRLNRQTNDSMSWVMQSSPVAAVVARSQETVSCGSTIAARGTIIQLRMLFFNRRRGQEMTALRVASAPVPAVVGTATSGSGHCWIAKHRPTPSR